ncbi:MAG TPA: hypothetical protein VFO19_06650 [Vicinamibacterales bacterium]|nr:hypothetical protein [Vicinamibacterales bacterium]
MRTSRIPRTGPAVWVASATAAVLLISVGIRAAQAPQMPAGPPARMIPTAASSILLNPDALYGANVSLIASVETVLSKTAFSVDQDPANATGKDLLILAPSLQQAPDANAQITVIGEVFKFAPEEVAKRAKGYTLDLPADQVEKFLGKPAVLATSVISPKLVDLAKRLPPPMTPDEIALDKAMKSVSASFNAARPALEASNAADAKTSLAGVKAGLAEAQAFFKKNKVTDAIGWADEATKLVETIEGAVATGNWDAARSNVPTLQQKCTQCHTARRERFDDGTYRFKG